MTNLSEIKPQKQKPPTNFADGADKVQLEAHSKVISICLRTIRSPFSVPTSVRSRCRSASTVRNRRGDEINRKYHDMKSFLLYLKIYFDRAPPM